MKCFGTSMIYGILMILLWFIEHVLIDANNKNIYWQMSTNVLKAIKNIIFCCSFTNVYRLFELADLNYWNQTLEKLCQYFFNIKLDVCVWKFKIVISWTSAENLIIYENIRLL